MSSEPQARYRVTAAPEQFATAARPVSYALINGFLAHHAIISETLEMRPTKLLVYLIIVTAAVQRVIRGPDLPEGWRGTDRMPRAVIGYISRRAIAEASGLPRENVRRIVNELIAEDRLLIGPRGALANKGGLLESQRILDSLTAQLTLQARTTQSLLDAGVLTIARVEPTDTDAAA